MLCVVDSVATFAVRHRQFSDEDFIARLGALAFGEFSSNAGVSTLHMARSDRTLIATRAEVPIGLAVVQHSSADLSYLKAIAVVEHERGHGVGRLLLTSVEREARALGATGLRLHTAEANVAALELFLKRGFQINRRMPRFYVGMYDACELVKHF